MNDNNCELILEWTGWPNKYSPDEAYPRRSRWDELEEAFAFPEELPEGGKHALIVWNFGVFEHGYRDGGHHIRSTALVIDYDSDPEEQGPAAGNPELTAADLRRCWGVSRRSRSASRGVCWAWPTSSSTAT